MLLCCLGVSSAEGSGAAEMVLMMAAVQFLGALVLGGVEEERRARHTHKTFHQARGPAVFYSEFLIPVGYLGFPFPHEGFPALRLLGSRKRHG